METIHIQHFGPLEDVEICDIPRLVVVIGNSSSGKSTLLKVITLFRWIYKMMCVRSFLHQSNIARSPFNLQLSRYLKTDRLESYVTSRTVIEYTNGDCRLTYKNRKLEGTREQIPESEWSLEKLSYISDQRIVIPALLQHGLTLTNQANFYLNETWEDYLLASQHVKHLDLPFENLRFEIKKSSMGERHTVRDASNTYQIDIADASSGVQNVVPLLSIVEYFAKHFDLTEALTRSIWQYVSLSKDIKSFQPATNIEKFPHRRMHLCIEEPELGLFPSAQSEMLKFLVNRGFHTPNDHEMHYLISTHSPYLLNYLNVLLIENEPTITLRDVSVGAYYIENGQLQDLMGTDENNNRVILTDNLSHEMEKMEYRYSELLNVNS